MIIHSILSKIKKKIIPPCLQGNYRNTLGELSYNFFYYFCFFFRQREALKNAVESFQDERNLHIEQYEKQQKVGTCSRGGRGWGVGGASCASPFLSCLVLSCVYI